jgi:hypothetical protein
VRPPAHGCVVRHEQVLAGPAERALSGSLSGAAAAVVFERAGQALSLWTSGADGTLQRVSERALEAKAARGAIACAAAKCELALVDERGRLLALQIDALQISAPRTLASGLDRRFAPALRLAGSRTLYAYTANVGDAMHTFWVVGQEGKFSPARDLTPVGHGAAAPSFVLGNQRATLIAVDAHAGMSPLLEFSFDAAEPSAALVGTPVSQPYEPPLLAAIEWPGGEVEVDYTAVGRLAMTAVGRVLLRKPSEPTALSGSKGYGELSFAVARSRKRALFALEVPVDAKPDAKRELALKLSDGRTTTAGPVLPADARKPSVAALADPGEYLVTYAHAEAIHALLVACDD